MTVSLFESAEPAGAPASGYSVTATSAPSSSGAGTEAAAGSPSITVYGANGQPFVIDTETLQFWLLLIQTVVLVALLVEGRRP